MKPDLQELVGRMLMVGFEGEDLGPDLVDLLLRVRPGGIILFKRNVGGGPRQVFNLIRECQDLARTEFGRPLLVAVDQEGGPVTRLGPPFSVWPSQRQMAGTMSGDEVRGLGQTSGRELAAVGINMNLTPVLDLSVDPEADFMAERSFGPDPEKAALYGRHLVAGHARHGVLTCLKHFPGIGDVRQDPHLELPTVNHPAQRIRQKELLPFTRLIEKGVAAVMTAHVHFPSLDPKWPGTFSSRILTDLLRGELGFSGLVLTDDLEMGAVVNNYRLGPAAVRTVIAGSDLLLVCKKAVLIEEVFNSLLTAARDGRISRKRLEASSTRLEKVLSNLPDVNQGALHEVFHDL